MNLPAKALGAAGEPVECGRNLCEGSDLHVGNLARAERRLVPERPPLDPHRVEPEGPRGLDVEVDAVADHHGLLRLASRLPQRPFEDRWVRLRHARLLRDHENPEEPVEALPSEDVPHGTILVRDHSDPRVAGALPADVRGPRERTLPRPLDPLT